MTESLEYARGAASRLKLNVKAYSATNGVMNDSQIDWIIQNLNGLSVSFDGLPSAHDKHRLTVLGQGSSAQVERSLRRIDAAGFPYGIRVTVTADQIANLSDSIRHICSNFNAQRVQVEPAYQLGRWNDAASSETESFIEAFPAAELVAKEHGRSLLFSAARVGALTNHFCGITQDSFALSPDGNVSACYEVFSEDNPFSGSFFYGRPNGTGYEFNLPVLNNLRRQAVQHREFCSGCFAKWTCAGDCYHKSLTVNGPGEFAGSDRCHITRELPKIRFWLRSPTPAVYSGTKVRWGNPAPHLARRLCHEQRTGQAPILARAGSARLFRVRELPVDHGVPPSLGRRKFLSLGAAIPAAAALATFCAERAEAADSPIRAHRGSISSLLVAADGSLLVSGSGDEKMTKWSLPDGAPRGSLGEGLISTGVWALSPDGSRLARGILGGAWIYTFRRADV